MKTSADSDTIFMPKHCHKWNSVREENVRRSDFSCELPDEPNCDFQVIQSLVGARHKHFLRWKTFKRTDVNGYYGDEDMPLALEKSYRGTLLSKILLMPKQTPIFFNEAVDIACKKADAAFSARRFGNEPGA